MIDFKQISPFDTIIKPVISKITIIGFHPENPNILAKLWWNFNFISLLLWIILSFVHMKHMNNVQQIGDVVLNISCISQPIVGLFTIRKYRKNLLEILHTIQNKFWFAVHDINKKNLMQHQLYYHLLLKISTGYQVICYACLAIWFGEPIFHSSGKFAMDMTFPYNNFIKEFPYFQIIYLAQAITVAISSSLVVLLDIVYVVSIGFALIQIDLIKQKLKRLDTGNAEEKQMYGSLKECIEHHNVVLHLLQNIEQMYRLLMLDKLLCDILCLCCATYLFSVQKNLNLKILLILAASGSQPFLYCFFGDFVTSECASIGEEAYAVNWENYGFKSVIFGLSMMILRSQKPVLMTAGGMIIFSLPSFVAFVRLLFSLYIAMEHLDNN